jgi:hypothetical protein
MARARPRSARPGFARARGRSRACLNCDVPFWSPAPSIRLCPACRSRARGLEGGFAVVRIPSRNRG